MDDLPPPADDLPPPADDLPPPSSDLPPPADDLPPPADDMGLPPPGDDLPPPASDYPPADDGMGPPPGGDFGGPPPGGDFGGPPPGGDFGGPPPGGDDLPPPMDMGGGGGYDDGMGGSPGGGGGGGRPGRERGGVGGGKNAVRIESGDCDDAEAVRAALKLRDGHWGAGGINCPVLYLVGELDDLDEASRERLEDVYRAGVLRAAFHTDAVIVDGGQASGVVAGPACDLSPRVFQLGISPMDGADNLSRRHTQQIVITDKKRFGDEAEAKCNLVKCIAGRCRVVCVFMNGTRDEAACQKELRQIAKMGWPILPLKGSGGLADELAEETETPGWLPGGKVAPVSLGLTAAELASYMHIHLTVDVFGM